MPAVLLRPARPDEANALSDLALRSKGHWGYDATFLAACRSELTVHAEQCDGSRVVLAHGNGTTIGYYRLAGNPPRGELTDLFVDPVAIGTGIGALLLRDALQQARRLGMQLLSIDADPHAEGFYLRSGAVRVGAVPSGSLSGRLLPRLELPVPPAPDQAS